MNDRQRIFVAVALDESLQAAVAALEDRLEAAGAELPWVKPEKLHITLRFLGHISGAELDRVRSACQEAARRIRPFQITLSGVGAFPNHRRPRVVWVGVGEGASELKLLAERLEEGLARQSFPKEARAFHPHLTLARVRESTPKPSLGRLLAHFQGEVVGTQRVASLLVMESLLRPGGAIYTQVEEVPLSTYEK